jgi:endonuclease IV
MQSAIALISGMKVLPTTFSERIPVSNLRGCSGNAFALFLKSQRKWDNPPLETEHRDLFRKYCADHSYDASK